MKEKCLEFNINGHLLFIDYQQAFDGLSRAAMSTALVKNGVPNKLVKLIAMTLKNATAKVKIGRSMSDPFNIVSRVRQGDVLSTTLFNIALHEAVKDTIKTESIINKL